MFTDRVVISVNIFERPVTGIFQAVKHPAVQQFRLEPAEQRLGKGIVIMVVPAGHALAEPVQPQQPPEPVPAVLAATVRMGDEPPARRPVTYDLSEGRHDDVLPHVPVQMPAHYPVGEQVEPDGKVQPLVISRLQVRQVGNIPYGHLVRCGRQVAPFQQQVGAPAQGRVALGRLGDKAFRLYGQQALLPHPVPYLEPAHPVASVPELFPYPAGAVPALVGMEYPGNRFRNLSFGFPQYICPPLQP